MAQHRMRSQLAKFRTAQINCLHGLLTEYGEVLKKGVAAFKKEFPPRREECIAASEAEGRKSVGGAANGAATVQRSGGGDGKQNGADGMGVIGTRSAL